MGRRYSPKTIVGGRPKTSAFRPKHRNPEANPLRPLRDEHGSAWLASVAGCDKSTVNRSISGFIIYPGLLIDGLATAYEEGRLPGVDLPAVFAAYGTWLREDPEYFQFVQYHCDRYRFGAADELESAE